MSADLPMAPLVPPSVEPTTAPAAVHFLAPRELVVLDGTLPDARVLRDAIAADRPDADLLVLDPARDALDQIGDRLASGAPVSAIHLVAHGQAGQFVIRGAVIDASELARRTAQFQTWNLADHADILLYGCNVADGANGEAFVRMLAELTGADVAASTDLTGSEDRGGDWTLEFVTGDIDTATIAGPRLRGRWHGTLDTTPVAAGDTAAPSFSTPLAFERNEGQTDGAVEFLARGSGYAVFLDDGDAVIDVRHGDGTGNVVRLSLDGAQTPVASTGGNLLSGTSHYLTGDVSDWHRDVAHYGSVRYDEVYDGIDVQYYGADRRLEYDFLVDAGVDTDVIGLRIEGAVAVEIAENGELVLTLDGTGRTMTFHAPVTYQRAADGSREHVDSRYVLRADDTVGFDLGDYDRSRELVIDPILGYATYLGGTGLETIEGVEIDSSGNVYVTGRTGSAAFPTSVGAYDTSLGGSTDAFVSKFNSAGALQYSTYFGGTGNEWAYNLTVDGSGQVYVVGETTSSDLAIVNGADSTFAGSSEGFLVKLNAAGSAILYSTYYGGANADYLAAVHMGSGSTVYVAGGTIAATWDGYGGAIDTGASGAGSLTWSQTYAAAGTEKLYDMDVDSTGDIWLIGETSTASLAYGNAYDSTHDGSADVFLVRMSAAGAVEYVSYYGGTGNDYGSGVVVAADNTLYITGISYSTGGIASTGAYDTTGDGTNGNAFLVHLDPSQTGSAQRLFGTYYGTSGTTFGYEIAIDAEGRPVVVGQTSGTVPTTVTGRDTTLSGSSDGFVAIFAADGSALKHGSYLGGDGTESANAVAVDTSGRLYVVGQTASTTFHTTGAYDTTGDATNADGFIAQFLPLASEARASAKGGLSINTDGGNDAYLIADNGGAILGSRTALTLEFDFAVQTAAATDNRLLSYAVSGVDNEVSVRITAAGHIVFTLENATTTSTSTYAHLLDGNRHQLAITWDRASGNGAFYVDGVLAQSFTGFKALANIDAGGTLVIGQDQDAVNSGYSPLQMFSGTLYDVRVFSDVRTATEIRASRLAELPRTEGGLVANWRFDDWHTDGTTTEALSGNDLTLGHASGTGFVTSHPSLTFVMNENAATGTVVGSITALSDDRQARIDALLAADATLTYSAQTDKFYKRDTTFRTWTSALSLATSTTLNTVAGQLVTVRSATENALLSSITGGSAVWLGAADASAEGTWRWYDGSTPADAFWQGTASGYRIDGAYTSWNAGEPSDTGGEDRLYQQADGTWNDAPDGMTSWTLIEWDADEVLDASRTITYLITSQTVTGAFAIDSDTGILTVADSFNYVAGVPHTLTVRVTEGSLTYDRTYTVVLTDEVVEVSGSTPGAQSVTEDTALTFSSGGGNAISVSDGSGASNTRMQVSLSASQGTLTLSQTTGLTIVSGANGSAAMVIDGTESALNAALAGMTYTPTAQYSGSDTLQVATSLSADLAARYTFDTGAVVDSAAGTAQNGSFVGNATTTTDATRGTVLALDGAGDSVQIASVFGNPSNVTVGGWVNLYTAASRGEMISLNDRIHISLDEPGIGVKGSIQTGAASWNDLDSGRFIAGDGWHHVMFVVDDTNDLNTLYIDGIAVASETNTSSVYWTGATTTYLGQHPSNTAYLHGLLDDMRVYTRALSADEVAAIAAEQRTTDPDTVSLTVNAVNDAPEDLYFVPELAESSLTGVYTFSVGSDLGRDAAGEDAAMTLYGSPSQTTGATGSGALNLAGGVSGQYGDLAGITTGGAMTIAGQVRFDSTAAWQRIVDFGQANSTGITAIYVGRFGTTNDLTFTLEKDLGGGNWLLHRATAAGAIVDGTWMHFTATVDGTGAMALYVNGVLADTEAGVVPEVGVRTNNYVGRSNWAGDALFDGAIDNLIVASGALSTAGVAALHQQSNAVTIADNAADGTVLGTIVVADVDSANTHTFGLTDSAAGRFAIDADGTLRVGMGSLLEYASATSHTLTARATDAGSLTRDEVFTVTLTAVNEAPSFVSLNGTPAHTEGGAAVVLDADVQINDPELSAADDFSGATLTLARNGGADSDDALAFDGINVTVSGANVSVGGTQIGTYGFTGGELVVTFGANATQPRVNTLLRNIVYRNWSDAPPASVQIDWTFSDGNAGGQGSGTALSVTGNTTVSISATNNAPVLNNTGTPVLATVTEDAAAPSGAVGTLVSTLVDFATPAGQIDNVTDADGAAVLGIAVTEADATNGTWFYSIDNGATWNALGAVGATHARLLAADAGTRVYFQGNADFAGTITNAITFHAWDRTSGANGSVTDISDDTVLDEFSSVSYTGNDGTTNWTSAWVETDVDGGGASGGRLLVRPTGDLEIRARATNNNLYREVDLSGASAATLSFDFVNTLSAGDTIVVQASGNGGASYTTLTGGTFSSSSNTGSGTFSLDISSFAAANTRIRFLVSSVGGEDRLYVDNVQIASPGGRTGGSSAFSLASDTASLIVSAVNDAPAADAGGPYTIAEGATLVLTATGSSDPDGDTLTYAWDLDNDGIFGEPGEPVTAGPSVTWATLQSFGIDDDGSYTIGLRVGDGTVNVTATTTVTVTNAAPTVTVSGATSVAAGQTYTLTVGVTDAGADTVTSWTVNWGDGNVSTYAGAPTSATHTFVQGGFSRGITVSVTDEEGSYSPSDLLLSSYLGDQVLRLDGTSGSLEATLPSSVTVDGPTGLAIGPDGYLYVASFATDQVVRYDLATNTLVGTFVTAASGGLDTPAALAFGPDGNLYVASSGTNQILKYDGSTGAFLGAFASLNSANALAWGPDGHLYAGSWFTGEVRRFDISGAPVDAGTFLTVAGGFGVSSLIFGTDGYLYVGDAGSTDLLKYDATTGALAATIDGNNAPYGLAIGPDGRLLVADFNAQAVERFRVDTGASLGNFDDGATGVDHPWGLVFHPSVLVAVTAGTPGVTVSPMSGSTSEAGGTATFSVVLDSAPLAPVTIALSSGDATEGTLSVSSVTFTVSNWNTAETVTVTGVDDALGDGDVTFTIVTGAASSADPSYDGLAVADVTVINADDEGIPVHAVPASASLVEDTPFAFTGANTISIADGDGNLTTVSASVSFGSLVLALTGGATVSAGALGSAALTLSGSLAALNASLVSLTYTPDADFDGTDTLTLVSTDATALSDTDTITLAVTPVDDAPVLTGLTLSVAQGGTTMLSTADFTIVDPDGPGGTRMVDVRNLAQGTFELTTAPGVPVTSFDFADVAAGLVRFVHSGAGAAPSFEASVRDSLTPGTFVPAAVGFTPTPVVTTPGPSPEQAYSLVLTPATPPSETPQESSGPARPADPVTTGTASQSGETAQSAGGRGGRSPGSVDPRILMQMAVPRTPAAAGGDASGNAESGRGAATVGAAGSSAGVVVSAPTAAPVGSSGVPAGAQVPTVEAVTPDQAQSVWNAPAPLTVALPGAAETAGPENRSAEEQQFDIMVNGVRLTGVSLSVGVVTWALRAGGIVSSLLASLPAWRFVDPLPVLERAERARVVWRDDEDDGVGHDAAKRDRAVEDLFGGPS